jgi:hypothetical protein
VTDTASNAGTTWTSRNYSIQAFVEGAWKEVAAASGQGVRDFSVSNFAPLKTTRLRVVQPEGGGNAARPNIMWLREVEAF